MIRFPRDKQLSGERERVPRDARIQFKIMFKKRTTLVGVAQVCFPQRVPTGQHPGAYFMNIAPFFQ